MTGARTCVFSSAIPSGRLAQTPRFARCFRPIWGQFPETCRPPPGPPLAGGELCCAQGFLRNEGPVRVRGGIGAHFQCGVRGLRSECRGLVPGTVSVIGRPETTQKQPRNKSSFAIFPCNARLPPCLGGFGGGRAALDYPSCSTSQTPRCARCFRPNWEQFPETCRPPLAPPWQGGNCAAPREGAGWVSPGVRRGSPSSNAECGRGEW